MGLPAMKQVGNANAVVRSRTRLRLVPSSSELSSRSPSSRAGYSRAPMFKLVSVLFLLAAACGLARVSLSARVAEDSIDAVALRKTIKAESVVADRLEIDKSLLVTPSRIESVAAGSMQMTKASSVRYLAIPEQTAGAGEASSRPVVSEGKATSGQTVAGIFRAAAAVTEKEARDLLVGDAGLVASE